MAECDSIGVGEEVPFCPATDEERQDFLTRQIQQLCNRIQPRKFYPHLRSKYIMDKADMQLIENGNLTDIDKAGALIDLMLNRGRNAFVAFITVLEYHYPELYSRTTHCQPRPPPPEWLPRMSSGFSMLTDFALVLEQHMNAKLQDADFARRQILAMKSRISATEEDATKEIMTLRDDLFECNTKLAKCLTENERLTQQMGTSRDTEMSQEKSMFKLRRELNEVAHKLKIATGEVTLERERSKRYHTREAEVEDLNTVITSLNNTISGQQSEINDINDQLEQHIRRLHDAKVQYDVLEDDYKGDKRRYEESIQRQNCGFRELQDQCQMLEKEKKVIVEGRGQQKVLVEGRGQMLDGENIAPPDYSSGAPSPRPRLSPISLMSPHKRPQPQNTGPPF